MIAMLLLLLLFHDADCDTTKMIFFFLFLFLPVDGSKQHFFISLLYLMHFYFIYQNWSIWERIHQPTVPLDPSVMICSIGKQRLWAQMTLPMPEEFSFSISTFQRIIHSNHLRFILQPVSTIVTSTQMVVSVWTF